MSWHKLRIERRLDFQFLKKKSFRNLGSKKIPFSIHLLSEVEENRELAATWQLGARLAQFVKECVRTRLVIFWFFIFFMTI